MQLVFANRNWITRIPVNRYEYYVYVIKKDEPLILFHQRYGYSYLLPFRAFLNKTIPVRVSKWKRDWDSFPHCPVDKEFCKYYSFEEWKKNYLG